MTRIDVAYLLLSLRGRISRSRFWIGTLILAAVSFAVTYLVLGAVGISNRAVLLSMLVAFALAYPSYALMAKRFQDRDKPGWTDRAVDLARSWLPQRHARPEPLWR